MHLKTALFGLNFDAFEYSWDETGGATRIGLALLLLHSINTVRVVLTDNNASTSYCFQHFTCLVHEYINMHIR